MNSAAIITLLHLATSLLTGIQNNASGAPVATQQAITTASQAIQEAVQMNAMPEIPFPIQKNASIWPNITELLHAPYLSASGTYAPLGTGVNFDAGNSSFGDLNADGADDAALVVDRTDGAGNTTAALAAMLNQDGIMFNIADLDLGNTVQILSHNIDANGNIILNLQIGNQPAVTSTYYLLGDQLFKE